MIWEDNDGGRAAAGFKGSAGDCVVRAIAIADEQDYLAVYNDLGSLMRQLPRKAQGMRTPRDGVPMPIVHEYLRGQGWDWTPTMQIGQGCTVHLRPTELPAGRVIARVTRHLCAVIDGVLHDTSDVSRMGTRCVYGYWTPTP